jgi:hypothetical protein
MKLQKTSIIGLLTIVIILNIIIGHFLPPAGILITPLIISVMIGLIVFTDNGLNIIEKSVLSYLYIGLNDIGIKLFSGGKHDMEGVGWIHMMLYIGLVPCFIMLSIGIFRDKDSSIRLKILSVIIFVLLIYAHLEIFETLGVNVN